MDWGLVAFATMMVIVVAIFAAVAWSGGEVVGSMRCAGPDSTRLTVRRGVRGKSDFASVSIKARVGWSMSLNSLVGAEALRLADALEAAASKVSS